MTQQNKTHSLKPYRFAFVLDQQVGLRTQALNLERVARSDHAISPAFISVRYERDSGLLTRIPGIPNGMKGTLRGVNEIRDGFGDKRFDAVLWATWAAKSVPDLVDAAPAFFVMDMTPVQMEAMGDFYGYGKRRAQFLGTLKRRATDRIYNSAMHFFPWSQFVAESLECDYGVSPDRITVISPGVDIDLYRPDESARPDDGIVRLLFVGGDFGRKGGDLLLRWLRERRSRGVEDCEVHVVTRDTGVASEDGLVIHRGIGNNSPELVRLYQDSDLFVLPTRADCYSLVAMEAMATGLPVVISNIGGIPDIVSEGTTGFLIPPDDYEALADRLARLVGDSDLRERMGLAARVRTEALFDCRKNIDNLLDRMKLCSVPKNS